MVSAIAVQYIAGCMSRVYQVRPSSRVRAAVERDEPELAVRRSEEAVQVRREDAGIGTPLVQRRRLRDDVEGQPPRRVPHGNGLDERAGRELAVADRADAAALEARPQRIGETGAEVPAAAAP